LPQTLDKFINIGRLILPKLKVIQYKWC